MSTAQALSDGTLRQSADLKLEVGERLRAVAREWTADQRRRLRKALDRAANLLEQEAPAILGDSPEGHPFAGLYSTIARGNLLVIIAGPKRALATGMRVAEIDEVLSAGRKFKEEGSGLPIPYLVALHPRPVGRRCCWAAERCCAWPSPRYRTGNPSLPPCRCGRWRRAGLGLSALNEGQGRTNDIDARRPPPRGGVDWA